MNLATKPAEKVIEILVEKSIRQAGYITNCKGNVKELNGGLDDLERERQTLKEEVEDAKRNLKEIKENVDGWFNKAEDKISEGIKCQYDKGHEKMGCFRFTGLLPFLWYRHRLGRKALKLAADVKLLIDESKSFGGVSLPENPTFVEGALCDGGYEEFESRKDTMNKIMAKLEDPAVRMIGVYGPGGVGKTTLVTAIADKARENKLFIRVATVAITNNPNPQKIQDDIAYVLGLRLEAEGETGRGDRLRRRLKKERENTLLILDDLWNGLDLNKLGIPFDDDDDDDDLSNVIVQGAKDFESKEGRDKKDFGYRKVKKEKLPGDYKGCKILLTSRFKDVLFDKMNVEDSSIFHVKELDEKEAMMLFKKVAEIQDENSKFKPEIVNKYCAGLPVAIVTVGRALRNKSETVWEHTLEKLKKEELIGVQNSMEISVKMSYDRLETEELKFIFLLCARMGHQPLIMDLVKYCFGLGILKGVYTLRDARDRISSSVKKLKDSGLVLDGNSSDHFNMHDMVREAALSIARKEQNVFTLRNDKLDDWPDKDELERCTAISIHNCDILDELPTFITCPQLKVLHIDTDDPLLKIPSSFFERMEKLRLLILTGFHLACLPSSIKCLSNLRMLCLERCVLSGGLSIIGELKKLRVLSFSGSEIENLPAELGCLSKLQLLDISDCSIGKVLSPDFISNLTSLQELYIRKGLIEKNVEGEANQSLITILTKLRRLHQLTFLDICIPSATILNRSLFFNKLTDYKIVVGDSKILSFGDFKMPNKYEASRSLALQLKDGIDIHSLKWIKMLFNTVENMLLGEIKGVQNAFYELNLNGFPGLKHLSIINNQDIEYIINSMELWHPQDVFPKLESLSLYQLRNIKLICRSLVTGTSFNKLKTIKVKMCSQLKNLFSFYLVKFLTSLEAIDVSECDSLEEIVIDESRANTETVSFQKIRSIALEWLPSFTSFYSARQLREEQATNSDEITIAVADHKHSDTASLSLFGELVEIQNLESLKLSSINIHNIWSDKPSSSFCFQNLIKLTVKACHNLRHLCSLSVASHLKKLKGLFVSECRMMETIFITKGNNDSEVCILPKLEEIQLSDMNMLRDIWPAKVAAESFSSLVSVNIVRCIKLDKVFPCHMVERFRSVDSLKVVGCKSVEVIFELKDSPQIHAFGIDTKLRLIYLELLPRLRQVWNRDPGGILKVKNLQSIEIISCDELRNMLPASVVKDLVKLEHFSVNYCDQMEEIVAWEERSETSDEPLVFPEVTYMGFIYLPNIRRFSKGRHTIQCPKLKRLAVKDCEYLETFAIEATNGESEALFSAEKVISNLEYMEIGLNEVKWLQRNAGKYRMHRLKELCLEDLPSTEILYWHLHRIPNLERLNLNYIGFGIKELVPSGKIAPQERLGTVLQLKELTLYWSFEMEVIGFERDPVLQTVERLVLRDCNMLIKLAHSSVSFTHLTYLEVNGCGRLINLMAFSTAESLVQLTTMKVINCRAMKIIVTNEGYEQDTVVDVVFSKLTTLELLKLKNLTSFCSYKSFTFKFPSLEKLIVRDCPRMKTFTESDTRAPKLQNILADEGEEGEKWYWQGDLNATIQQAFTDKVSFQFTDYLELSYYYPELERQWHGNDLVQESSFRNLKTLVVDDCENLVHVIPSHLLPCFKNLEELRVQRCRAVQVIFNINDLRVTKALRSLKTLSLIKLPKLEHVWDKDAEGILDLQVLQDVNVNGCSSLKNLLSVSVAKDLAKLEQLRVTNCKDLVEIFAKDENSAEGTAKEFAFPCLRSLQLRELPGLKYFYPGLHMLEWPVLEELHVDSAILMSQEARQEEQLRISIEKVIPSLEILSLSIGDTMITWEQVSRELACQNLQRFQQESDSAVYRFLQMVSNIEKLQVQFSSLEEMFSAERPNADYTGVFSHLKELKLYYLGNLKSIGLEHSWLHPIPENLHTLELEDCGSLINLVPSTCTVSFSNLTYLAVSDCGRLVYLLTCSTAKSLGRLKRMKISGCRSMQEIVCKEGDESPQDQDENIIFGQLQDLYLNNLPKLRWFYPGNYTLRFPSLEQVYVIKCQRMKTFCAVSIINPTKLSSGVFIKDEDAAPGWRWEGDLNTTIRKTYEEKIGELTRGQWSPDGDDCLVYQDICHGLVLLPDNCFNNLESLILHNIGFLIDVVPAHLLSFLPKLESLEVDNCISVKSIFDVKSLKEDRNMINMGLAVLLLKKLILKDLPNLENVWNEDPDGILRVQLLQQVSVDKCECLTSLFPASVAKDLVKLENLVVQNCERLMAIIVEDEAAQKGTNLEFPFPCLQSLTLLDLPKLEFLYFSVHGFKLKFFAHHEPHIEDEVCVEKVIRNLEYLSLGEKELKMVLRVQIQGNHFEKMKVLGLMSFDIESDELPFRFLQKAPNIEKLVVKSSSFEEIFCSARPNVDYTCGFLSRLKGLELASHPELISIGLEHSWVQESFLYNLETLEVTSCSRLSKLVPSPVCFSNLMHLTVTDCDELRYMFTSSTAKSLARLKQMDVSKCKSIQEVVSTEGDESHDDEIKFEQLRILKLENLPNLRSFYNGSFTLSFPSLEQLSLLNCDTMRTFCLGTINANKLSAVKFNNYGGAIPLEVDLNSTIRKGFQETVASISETVDHLELDDSKNLLEIWHGSFRIPYRCFSNLNTLIVNGCQFLTNVIPCHILGLLSHLGNLEVRQCQSVKAIFEVKDTAKDAKNFNTGPVFSLLLKKLSLQQLPNLKHVWDSDPQRVISFPSLQQVCVHDCNSLESVFPASVAEILVNLEKLDVQDCAGLLEIVAKDEAAAEGTYKEFVLTCVTSVTLKILPKLKCFYPDLHKLECPNLKFVHLYHCNKLKTFTCDPQCFREPQPESPLDVPFDQQALFTADKVIPYLETLALNKGETMMICHGQLDANLLHKLQAVHLQCFHNVSDTFPYELLEKVPNIGKLVVDCSSFKEIFCSQRPYVDCNVEILSRLKTLTLHSLSQLNSVGLEYSWLESISKNLEALEISECHCLRNIVPSTVSFCSLTDLKVSQCHGLVYLFTPSTARSLHLLKKIWVQNCESLQEIMFEQAEESSSHVEDEIIFDQLDTLSLHSLPRLKRFYNWSCTLSFPSLDQLSVIHCRMMETFCAGNINVNKLSQVQFEEGADAIALEVDLNTTIRKAFEATVAKCAQRVKHLKLDDNPELYAIWHDSFRVPFGCFRKLKSLVVEKCEFLSNVIPSHILGLLCNLEELVVGQCPYVKVIFEVKDIAKDINTFDTAPAFSLSLKKLSLQQLPNLKHVWDSDPQQVISFPRLKQVCVHDCNSLESLFPASMAEILVNLEKLDVQNCAQLLEIVAKDEAAAEGTYKEFVLTCMTSITLKILPAIKCFYPGPHKLECPNLKCIYLYHCDKLKTFACESQSLREAQSESPVDVPFDQQALFTAKKVIPYLETLALNKEETMIICHEQFDVNLLHKLQALHLQCFHNVSDPFPYELLQNVPNIEKLVVDCSSFKEIFCFQRPNTDCTEEILSHLKTLTFNSLTELNAIGLEHSWLDSVSENLEALEISECHSLRNIVPSTVSFSSLTDLKVSQCGGLVYLFTSSTARSLHLLKKMWVQNCESLQEIMFEGAEDSSSYVEDETIFDQLNTLSLHSLPRLGRFYNGSCRLSFPSLDQLSVIQCRMMETFCAGTINANRLSQVQFEEDADVIALEVDLNSTIRKGFEARLSPTPTMQ